MDAPEDGGDCDDDDQDECAAGEEGAERAVEGINLRVQVLVCNESSCVSLRHSRRRSDRRLQSDCGGNVEHVDSAYPRRDQGLEQGACKNLKARRVRQLLYLARLTTCQPRNSINLTLL